MKTKLAILTLLAASSMFARVVVGVGVGFGGGYYAPAPPAETQQPEGEYREPDPNV